MLGMYLAVLAWSAAGARRARLLGRRAARGAVVGAVFGALVEALLLRRLYDAPELLQLLATFALVLVIKDFALWAWGPEDLLGPRAPGLRGAVEHRRAAVPAIRPVPDRLRPAGAGRCCGCCSRARAGARWCAPPPQDREMAGALGVNQRWLFTGVFALGALLAGLGGALQIPREPANLTIDLPIIADAFVVVVVGGLGSIPGAFLAALLIGEIKSFCIGLGNVDLFGVPFSFSKLTLVVEFIVMAVVLVLRPWGLLGKPSEAAARRGRAIERAAAHLPAARRLAAGRGAWPLLALLPLVARRATRWCCSPTSSSSRCSPPACTSSWGRRACTPSATPPTSASAPMRRGAAAAKRGLCRWKPRCCSRRSCAGAGRAGVRLVLRAALGRLPRDAHARVRADRLVGRLPVGRLHRRLERPGRRLAGGLARASKTATTT